MTAAELYEAVQSGDYCELVWFDGRRQTKVLGAYLYVGHAKPVCIVSTRGHVVYRLALDDQGIILFRE